MKGAVTNNSGAIEYSIAPLLSFIELHLKKLMPIDAKISLDKFLDIPHNNAMPKRSSIKQGSEDTNEIAFHVLQQAVGEMPPSEPEKNPAAVALGRLGGKKGGNARAAKLTPEQRSEIARVAAAARWGTRNDG